MQYQLFLSNTLSKTKELFTAKQKDSVSLYVCGITPYDYSHIGHGRTYINFDLLVRLLKFLNFNVTYVRNITDIDDKLLNKATEQNKNYLDIANFFYQDFQNQMQKLNCLTPTIEPRATESIEKIIAIIDALIQKGHAYQTGHDVYFNIATDADYGKLSKKKQEDLLSGARVELNDLKKNPGDFALWKGNDKNEFWQSPWGYGRPGWHIECSAMIAQHLDLPIDIHAGGIDLIFPHHENEIAQSESATNKALANYWLHNEFININKEKMSKSLNNSIKLNEITQQENPAAFRLYILQHHYKTPIEFSYDGITSAEVALNRLYQLIKQADQSQKTPATKPKNPIFDALITALCDDLNTPKALGIIFENYKLIQQDPELTSHVALIITDILGLSFKEIEKKEVLNITPEIEILIHEREQARHEKNWKKADELRDTLQALGYTIQDKKL
jgi:cysteinyl-tRNA synthetase